MAAILCYVIAVSFTVQQTQARKERELGTCKATLATVSKVDNCPSNKEEWEESSAKKHCNAILHECSDDLVYHCVTDPFGNDLLEVCAPSVFIVGNRCAEFNAKRKGIQRNAYLSCRGCPIIYNSTDAFQYQECYTSTRKVDTKSDLDHADTDYEKKPQIDNRQVEEESSHITLITLVAIIAVLLLTVLILFVIRLTILCQKKQRKQKWYKDEERKDQPAGKGLLDETEC